MSLISAVERLIKSCKVEQAKLNDSIQHCREILHSITSQPTAESEKSEQAQAVADTSPGEKEDIDLLERALEKALRVRTGSQLSKDDCCTNNLSGPRSETNPTTGVLISSAVANEGQTTIRTTSKSARLGRKEHKTSGLSVRSTPSSRSSTSYKPTQPKTVNNRNTIQNRFSSSTRALHHRASRKFQQTVAASAAPDPITTPLSTNKTARSNLARDDDLSRAAAASTPSSNNIVSLSDTDGFGLSILLQQNGLKSDVTTKWKTLRSKQNRLWDKVISLQRKPVPGRSRFMERMRATFPGDWPCGSPDQTRALLDRLAERGLSLGPRSHAEETLARQASDVESELGLQQTAAELQIFADQVQKDWKAWDRWRPEGGCLRPTGANCTLGDGITSPLPLTITYRTEDELQELERLRMRVALLQQDIQIEQVLLDALSSQFASIVPGATHPSPSVLRDMYSLLGEGGERFPAIVLDSA
ncbi:uncharacterized protein tedc2 isoform X2 [Austrofundulus limnaeus]|uniref:Uncharacterized protein tedc2 isoform X2 n=1 Tax=Austrofundulus limnaeus TaxID=52670 RepID=A0A2I4BCS2_AUSLI|nr:PREDICTED: uncharacterized protein LOC106518696 isoform X2 [Austrofundulus limnaeus]